MARTFAPLRRLAFVLAVVASWVMIAVFIYNKMDRFNGLYERPDGFLIEVPKRVLSLDTSQIDWATLVLTLFFSIAIMIVTTIVIYGLYRLVLWIIYGYEPYVDPCQDPACPCQRHVVEREEDEAARIAAITAATTAVVTTTIVNS